MARIIVASDMNIAIRSFTDISGALGECFGCDGLILTEDELGPDFFELRTGLAGELFQKFINYGLRLALVVSNPKTHGERFSELAYEHASHNQIRFVDSVDQANAWLRRSNE